jgi:hypothetical protein
LGSHLGYLLALVLLIAAADQLSLLVSVVILFVRQPSPASAIKVDHDADT